MASSSADIIAAIRATAHSYSLCMTEDIISSIASEIEPTDGVMYDGVVMYDYIHGQLIERLGHLPPFLLIGIDLGGVVDTLQFNQIAKCYNWQDQAKFLEAYKLVKEGIRNKNFSFICKAATISSQINQKILPKPYFNEFEKLSNTCQGGLVIAHSGTVFGILLDRNNPRINDDFLYISRQISDIVKNSKIKTFYYVSRGIQL